MACPVLIVLGWSDDVTVRLHLDRPVAWGLIGNALSSSSSIVHAREIMKHATADDPYGTKWLETKTVESGPLSSRPWQKGSLMSLVPNPHAFQPAKLERIILQIIPDASTRRIVLERGDIDFAVHIATKDIPDLRKVSGVKVLSYPSARGWWLGMTWNKAPSTTSTSAVPWRGPCRTKRCCKSSPRAWPSAHAAVCRTISVAMWGPLAL